MFGFVITRWLIDTHTILCGMFQVAVCAVYKLNGTESYCPHSEICEWLCCQIIINTTIHQSVSYNPSTDQSVWYYNSVNHLLCDRF